MISNLNSKLILYLIWIIALVSTLTSLYFSEIAHFPPCILCWYQRIFMFPLAILLPLFISKNSKDAGFYLLPISIIGLLISAYHNLLYYGLIPESIAPCINGISCTTRQLEWFGFITIPLLSLTAFTLITILLLLHRRSTLSK